MADESNGKKWEKAGGGKWLMKIMGNNGKRLMEGNINFFLRESILLNLWAFFHPLGKKKAQVDWYVEGS